MKLKGDKVDSKTEQKILQVPGRSRDVLPRRRQHRLRRRREPLPVHGRRLEPVLLGRVRAARRLGRTATRSSTPAAARATRTTCAARSCASGPRPTAAATRSRRATCSRKGKAKTKPEIYAMGLRNPYRFAVNRANGDVYVGDYSPDADKADPGARPGRSRALDASSRSRPTMAGRTASPRTWPTSTTTSPPRRRARRSTARAGRPTTRRTTPASRRCRRSRARTSGTRTCSRRTSRSWSRKGPRARAASRRWAARRTSTSKSNKSVFQFPKYYDGKPLFYEWTRDYIKEMRLTKNRGLDGIFPFNLTAWVDNPMDMEFGPGRRAVRARVRRRLLRREPGRGAVEDQLRARQPHAAGEGGGDPRRRPGAADGRVLQHRDGRSRRRQALLRLGLRR